MKNYADNPRAMYDYEILERSEVGIVLLGFEVKAIQHHMASLKGSYVKVLGGELYLINAHISPYQVGNTPKDYEPTHTRKLLIAKKDILYFLGKTAEKGLTLLPIRIYTKGRRIKLEVGLARGKKNYDKREKLKRETITRELQRREF